MPNPLGPPYRPPCPGLAWPSPLIAYLGGPNQHCNPLEDGFPVYHNVTLTKVGGVCVPLACNPPAGRSCTDPPVTPADLSCGCGTGNVTIGNNCYALSVPLARKNFSKCQKIGFKNLGAAKFWLGRKGFTPIPSDGCTPPAYPATAPTTKYRTKTMVGSSTAGTVTAGVTTITGTASTARTYTVHRYTGLVTETVKTDSGYVGPGFNAIQLACQVDYSCGTWTEPSGGTGIATALNDPTTATSFTPPSQRGWVINGPVTRTIDTISFDLTLYSSGGGTSDYAFNNYVVTITLSDPCTAADVSADINALLQAWDLGDDTIYPWRTDGTCWLAPLITVKETNHTSDIGDSGINLFSLPSDTYSDNTLMPDGTVPDGSIVGLPVPAGYDPFWNNEAITYQVCGSPPTASLQVNRIGAYAPGWCPNATQWLDLNQGQWTFPGAWMQHNFTPGNIGGGGVLLDGKVIKCVWAETIMFAKPSHNYARPCGPVDAAAIDQTTATCVAGVVTGSVRFPFAQPTCPVAPAFGYQWNDTGAKGDFLFKEWQWDYRDYAIDQATGTPPALRLTTGQFKNFIATQACIIHTPCCPNVAYIAPGGVNYGFNNSVKYLMPEPGAVWGPDDTYGSLWQARVEQWMVDPLWQPPSAICRAQNIDDGTGTVGTFFPPYEEGRIAPPVGAPPYPAGCGVNYFNYVPNLNAGGDPIPECEFPQNGQCEYPRWVTWLNQVEDCAWDIDPDDCLEFEP